MRKKTKEEQKRNRQYDKSLGLFLPTMENVYLLL